MLMAIRFDDANQCAPIPVGQLREPIPTIMKAGGVQTLGELAEIPDNLLLLCSGIGRVGRDEIRRTLQDYGLTQARTPRGKERAWDLAGIAPTCTPDQDAPMCGVYFLVCERFIKIGQARDVAKRVQDLSVGLPFRLHLLGVEDALNAREARRREQHLHRRFEAFRHRGEWFHDAAEIRHYVRQLAHCYDYRAAAA